MVRCCRGNGAKGPRRSGPCATGLRWRWRLPDWRGRCKPKRACLDRLAPCLVRGLSAERQRTCCSGQGALIVLIARDDPLDTFLVHHPAALLDKPIERVVIDPTNPYILGPQLLCAATELPLSDAEVRAWGAEQVAAALVDDGLLRRRPSGYFPAPGVDPHPAVDIRGSTGGQVAILEADTGRMLGSTGAGQAPASVHPGAVYLHQGDSYVVDTLDLEAGIAFVHTEDPGYTTFARELTDIDVTGSGEQSRHGPDLLSRCFCSDPLGEEGNFQRQPND